MLASLASALRIGTRRVRTPLLVNRRAECPPAGIHVLVRSHRGGPALQFINRRTNGLANCCDGTTKLAKEMRSLSPDDMATAPPSENQTRHSTTDVVDNASDSNDVCFSTLSALHACAHNPSPKSAGNRRRMVLSGGWRARRIDHVLALCTSGCYGTRASHGHRTAVSSSVVFSEP